MSDKKNQRWFRLRKRKAKRKSSRRLVNGFEGLEPRRLLHAAAISAFDLTPGIVDAVRSAAPSTDSSVRLPVQIDPQNQLHNPNQPVDVNADGGFDLQDIFSVIDLVRKDFGTDRAITDLYPDVNDDGVVNLIDAFLSIDQFVNEDFAAGDDRFRLLEDSRIVALNVKSNDVHAEAGRIEIVALPESGTVDVVGGELWYAPNPDFNGRDSFQYSIAGARGPLRIGNVELSIEPVNDRATIRGELFASVAEDAEKLRGLLTVFDVDAGESVFEPGAWNGEQGQLTLTTAGNWEYDLYSSAVQSLTEGEAALDEFVIKTFDGTTEILAILTIGSNDEAIVSGDLRGRIDEDGDRLTGMINVVDVDFGESALQPDVQVGALGQLSVNGDGNWRYDLDTIGAQSLREGEVALDEFVLATLDGTTADIVIEISGRNDRAAIGGDLWGKIEEDDSLLTGQMYVIDVDLAEALFQPNVASSDYGSLTVRADGTWTFVVDSDSIQSLRAGEQVSEFFSIASLDGASAILTLDFVGANDQAEFAGASTGSTHEDGVRPVTGVLNIRDADAGEGRFVEVVGIGEFGEFAITADGRWSYMLDNAAAQRLRTDEVFTERFVVESFDGAASMEVQINVEGRGDVASIAGDAFGATHEDSFETVAGALTVRDVDSGEEWFVEVNDAGEFGEFALNVDGEWIYALDNSAAQRLRAGDSFTERFVVESFDGTVSTEVQVTVEGRGDGAIITGDTTGATNEDSVQRVAGELTVHDADAGEQRFVEFSEAGGFGEFTLSAEGHWAYALDNATAQRLRAGESISEQFVVASFDGTASTQVQITVEGRGDSAAISGVATGATHEDDLKAVRGVLTIHDADAGEDLFVDVSEVGEYGEFSNTADGHWTYGLDVAAAQRLRAGESFTEQFVVASLDATASTQIQITVEGRGDSATITGDTTGATHEDSLQPITGELIVHDADAAEDRFVEVSHAGGFGEFTITADGRWSYALDNAAAQRLRAGESITELFDVASFDGTASTQVQITVEGRGDSAAISGVDTGATHEDDPKAVRGVLTIHDADAGEDRFVNVSEVGEYGEFNITADGHWNYGLDNAAAQRLRAGESITEHFVVASFDGTASTEVLITVEGRGDSAAISGVATGATHEDDLKAVRGVLTIHDADAGEDRFVDVSEVGEYGEFNITADGHWNYGLDNAAAQRLRAGESFTEQFVVASFDETASTQVQITVEGRGDGAAISGVATGATHEDDLKAVRGVLTIHDADAGEDRFVDVSEVGEYGEFTITADGHWTYGLDNAAAQRLRAGESFTELFDVASFDGTASTQVQITVEGRGDSAAISGVATGATHEDDLKAVRGVLTIHDADAGEDRFVDVSEVGEYGEFSITADGHWTYGLDNAAAQRLRAGESFTERFVVASLDGTASTQVQITVEGRGDTTTISGDAAGATHEDSVQTVTGALAVRDADAGEERFVEVRQAGEFGDFDMNSAGDWIYSLESAAAQRLRAGESFTERFVVASFDGTASTEVQITIDGRGDSATIAGDVTGATNEDDPQPVSGELTIHDADAGEDRFVDVSAAGEFGEFSIIADGHWNYVLDNTAAQRLRAVDSFTERFVVASFDGTASTEVQIIVEGRGDSATITGEATSVTHEDDPRVVTGVLTVHDDDAGENWFVEFSEGGEFGEFAITADGDWLYTLDNESAQPLRAGDSFTERFAVVSLDGTASSEVAITVEGRGDSATIAGDVSGAAHEDHIQPLNGVLTVSDADAGENAFLEFDETGQFGEFQIGTNGEWSYTLNQSAAQQLMGGQVVVDPFLATSVDGTGVDIIISIEGRNDFPMADSINVSVLEDAAESSIDLAAAIHDVDGHQLDLYIVETPRFGVARVDGLNIAYTPNADFFGRDNVVYGVVDSHGGSAEATLEITVVAVDNDPPVASDDAYYALVGYETRIPARTGLLANDVEPDHDPRTTLRTGLVETSSNGALALDEYGGFRYRPNDGFVGTDYFTYFVFERGAEGQEIHGNTAIVTIDVLEDEEVAYDLGVLKTEVLAGLGTVTSRQTHQAPFRTLHARTAWEAEVQVPWVETGSGVGKLVLQAHGGALATTKEVSGNFADEFFSTRLWALETGRDAATTKVVAMRGSVHSLTTTSVAARTTAVLGTVFPMRDGSAMRVVAMRGKTVLEIVAAGDDGAFHLHNEEGITSVHFYNNSGDADMVIAELTLSTDKRFPAESAELNPVDNPLIAKLAAPDWGRQELTGREYDGIIRNHPVYSRRGGDDRGLVGRIYYDLGIQNDPNRFLGVAFHVLGGQLNLLGLRYLNADGIWPLPNSYYRIVAPNTVVIAPGAPKKIYFDVSANWAMVDPEFRFGNAADAVVPPAGFEPQADVFKLYAELKEDRFYQAGTEYVDDASAVFLPGTAVDVFGQLSNRGLTGGQLRVDFHVGYTQDPNQDPLIKSFDVSLGALSRLWFRVSVSAPRAPADQQGARPYISIVATDKNNGRSTSAGKLGPAARSMDLRVYNPDTNRYDNVSREELEGRDRLDRIRQKTERVLAESNNRFARLIRDSRGIERPAANVVDSLMAVIEELVIADEPDEVLQASFDSAAPLVVSQELYASAADLIFENVAQNTVDLRLEGRSFFEEMSQLAAAAYAGGVSVGDWKVLTAQDLILPDGDYSLQNGMFEHGNAAALVVRANVNGQDTVAISFRGTDFDRGGLLGVFSDPLDWFGLPAHFEKFRPLLTALDEFIVQQGVEQILATGHSLGGSMVPMYLNEHRDSQVEYRGVTFGSPGSPDLPSDARIVEFANVRDIVPAAGLAITHEMLVDTVFDLVGLATPGATNVITLFELYVSLANLVTDAVNERNPDSVYHYNGHAVWLDTGLFPLLSVDAHNNSLYYYALTQMSDDVLDDIYLAMSRSVLHDFHVRVPL